MTPKRRPNGAVDRFRSDLRDAAALCRQDLPKGRLALLALCANYPDDGAALRFLGRCLREALESDAADAVENAAIEASSRTEPVASAIRCLMDGQLTQAEQIVRAHLARDPQDVAALCVLADIANRSGVLDQAELLLREASNRAPAFREARFNLALIVSRRGAAIEAIALLDELLRDGVVENATGLLKLHILAQIGDYASATKWAEHMLAGKPTDSSVWLAYAHLLKTLGRGVDSEAAYRRSLSLDPSASEAWWGLADLKSGVLGALDIQAMRRRIDVMESDTGKEYVLFAIARAYEDSGNISAAYDAYAAGNELRRLQEPYSADATRDEVDRSIALFTAEFFSSRSGWGHPSTEPIFIIGMPRAGSTLLEQILASHSLIEGTSELTYIPIIAHQIALRFRHQHDARYPAILADLTADDCRALGEEYLSLSTIHRHSKRPYFIDKLPNNWLNVGLIKLILPRAKIIDARREAQPCCLSNYKQLFAKGQEFSYSLSDLGKYYRQYTRYLDHLAAVAPSSIHRLDHEALVTEPAREIRALLRYIGVDFETSCLSPEKNERAVRTASAQQVRRPISTEGLDRWRSFLPYLAPLQLALEQ